MSRVKPKRDTPRRRNAPRWTASEWQLATMALLRRCGYRCEKCGGGLGDNLERHHRQRREVGGDRLSNLLALHTDCHRYITEHPDEARANGWIVEAHEPDPELVPVRINGYLWNLHDDGTKTVVP